MADSSGYDRTVAYWTQAKLEEVRKFASFGIRNTTTDLSRFSLEAREDLPMGGGDAATFDVGDIIQAVVLRVTTELQPDDPEVQAKARRWAENGVSDQLRKDARRKRLVSGGADIRADQGENREDENDGLSNAAGIIMLEGASHRHRTPAGHVAVVHQGARHLAPKRTAHDEHEVVDSGDLDCLVDVARFFERVTAMVEFGRSYDAKIQLGKSEVKLGLQCFEVLFGYKPADRVDVLTGRAVYRIIEWSKRSSLPIRDVLDMATCGLELPNGDGKPWDLGVPLPTWADADGLEHLSEKAQLGRGGGRSKAKSIARVVADEINQRRKLGRKKPIPGLEAILMGRRPAE